MRPFRLAPQIKSPLQALRTFGKLLQRQLAEEGADAPVDMAQVPATARRRRKALRLADDLLSQGERVIGLLVPMDALIQSDGGRPLLHGDGGEPSTSALVWQPSGATSNEGNKRADSRRDDDGGQPRQRSLPPPMPSFGDFELEVASLQDILGPTVYAYEKISRECGVRFHAVGFEPDNVELPGVRVCRKHLIEAVSTVLDNALKYAPLRRKGKVGRPRIPHIRASLAPNDPAQLAPGATLYIEDNGPGIPGAERDAVFARGYRGEATREAAAGSGLGLAIAREVVLRMGGVIDVLEGEGPHALDGTTVRIVLFREPDSGDVKAP